MSSKRPFCVCEDVRPIPRVLQETGWEARNRSNNQHRRQRSLNSLFMEVHQAQQWISAGLDGGCPKRPKAKVSRVKTQQRYLVCCQPVSTFAKRSKLGGFSHLIFMTDTTSRLTLLFGSIWPCMLALRVRMPISREKPRKWWTGWHYAVGVGAQLHGSIVDAVVHWWSAHDKPPTIGGGWYI